MNTTVALKRILIIDDDEDYRKLLLTWLGVEYRNVEIIEYDPHRQGVPGADFDWSAIDVLLLDYELRMNQVTGLDILQFNFDNRQFPATIMLTGAGNEEVAVRAFKSGVADYLRKQWVNKEQVRKAVADAFTSHVAKREYLYTQEEVRQATQIETKKAFGELKNKFDTIRKMEKKQLENAWNMSEQARQKSEKEKQALLTEIKILKAQQQVVTEDAGIKNQFKIAPQQLERTHNDRDDIEQKIERAEANVTRTKWKQNQISAFQKQVGDDLSSFMQEFEQQQKQMSDSHVMVEKKVRISKEMARKKTAATKEINQQLINEIATQVGKKDD